MHRSMIVLVALVALSMILPGCRKPAKVILTKDQRSRIEENILKEPPAPKFPVNANFGDLIRLVGVDLSAEEIRGGQEMTITWYWECIKPVSGAWKVFVHLELPAGKRMVLDHIPVGELYPISQWQQGEIIRDVQTFVVDKDSKAGTATFWAGIFNEEIYQARGGGDRMTLKNKEDVKNDGDNRVNVARFAVQAATGQPAGKVPTLSAARIDGVVTIDGNLDEAFWSAAKPSNAFMNADGRPADPEKPVIVRAVYDAENLYISFMAADDSVETPYKNRDDELWNADVVEVYLDGGADGKDYLELQVSPANVVFDALFASHRKPDWKEASKWTMDGLVTAATVQGTLNAPGDDKGYTVEMKIPLAGIPGIGTVPPADGSTLRANFFRIDAKGGKVVGANAFSPASGDFHDLSKAGLIRFEGTGEPAVRIERRPPAALQKALEPASKQFKPVDGVVPNLPPTNP